MQPRFEFGDNWLSYLEKSLSEERMATAKDALCAFLDLDHWREKHSWMLAVGAVYTHSPPFILVPRQSPVLITMRSPSLRPNIFEHE